MSASIPIKINEKAVSRLGLNTYEIESIVNFPNSPSGGVITLDSGKYIIKESFSTANRFTIGSGAIVTIAFEDQRDDSLTYTGTDSMFTATDFSNLTFEKTNFICSGNGATFLTADGLSASSVLSYNSGKLQMTGTGTTVMDCKNSALFVMFDMLCLGYVDGFYLENLGELKINQTKLAGDQTSSNAVINILSPVGSFTKITDVPVTTGASQAALYVDPAIANEVNLSDIRDSGTGDIYESGVTGDIASFTDVSTSTTAVSVTDSSGDALFTSVAHGLVVGETAEHTTFTETSYNGDDIVTEVPSADTYKVGKSYVSDDSGLFATTTCQINDVANGRSNGESVSIFGTINFGGGYKVFNAQTDTFEITLGKAFPVAGSETTGNWDTSSLNGKSVYVDAQSVGDEPSSAKRGSFVIGGNGTATVVSVQDTFYDFNLGAGASPAGNIEGWTLSDPVTGEMRYDGLMPVGVEYSGTVSAVSTGAGQVFKFRLLKNGVVLDAPDNVDIPQEFGTAIKNTSLLWATDVSTGDKLRPQLENTSGTSNLTIDTIKVSIK